MNSDKQATRKAYMRAWLDKNRDHVRAYREATKEQRNARRRELYAQDEARRIKARTDAKRWQQQNPDKRKAQRLKPRGIGMQEYLDLLELQGGKCAICGHSGTEDRNVFPLVDHCHETGAVRGLLCMNCNQGLGKFRDNPDLLEAAINYLLKSRGSSGVG